MPVTQTISTDTAFQVLANQQRRRVLHHLVESNGSATIAHLAEAVVTDSSSPWKSEERRDRITLKLHHVHLPKLQEAGLIEYDMPSETIRYHPDEQIAKFLSACSSK